MDAKKIVSWLKENQVLSTAHLCLDSRTIQPGDVFFACSGQATHVINT